MSAAVSRPSSVVGLELRIAVNFSLLSRSDTNSLRSSVIVLHLVLDDRVTSVCSKYQTVCPHVQTLCLEITQLHVTDHLGFWRISQRKIHENVWAIVDDTIHCGVTKSK